MKLKQIKKVYKSVAALLRSKKRWTQGSTGRDATGQAISYLAPTAESFCLIGAIAVVYAPEERWKARLQLRTVLGQYDIVRFNDSSTHEEVLALVRKAGI